MSLSETSGIHFRPPSHIRKAKAAPLPSFQAPLEELFKGEWYMIRSSNPFWKDKRNVRLRYTPSGSHIDDRASYQTMTSDAIKSMDGTDTAVDDAVGMYTWQGKGILRIASARWEVLCFTPRPDGGDWMLVFAHKSIFTSPAVNLVCRKKEGLGEADVHDLDEWLAKVEDGKFQQAVQGMIDITQE